MRPLLLALAALFLTALPTPSLASPTPRASFLITLILADYASTDGGLRSDPYAIEGNPLLGRRPSPKRLALAAVAAIGTVIALDVWGDPEVVQPLFAIAIGVEIAATLSWHF